MAEQTTKEKIVIATIELIKIEKDVKKVSMRKIAKKAGIAVSVINYHFQTKDNLINLAVDKYIGKVISTSTESFDISELNIEERIRFNIKNAGNFIANNPGVSRVSILNDLKNPSLQDNSSQLFKSIYKQLEEYFKDEIEEIELKILVQQQIAAVQEIFLRNEVFKKQTGLDFFDQNDREKILDKLINNILRN